MEKNNKKLVSIIMPVYNTEKYVAKAINSLLNQSYKNIEILVVDDGSTDESVKVINNNYKDNSRVRLYRKTNGGASTARNLGLSYAKGYYTTFLDSDDTFDLKTVEILVERIEKLNSDVAIPCSFNEINIDGKASTRLIYTSDSDRISAKEFVVEYLIKQGTAWRCSSVIYRTDIIKNNNVWFYEGVTAEDYIFNLSYFKFINYVAIVKYPTLNVQKRQGSVTAEYNTKMMDLFLLLDRITIDFLIDLGFNKQESRKITDQLLIRNTVVFFTKTIKAKFKSENLCNILNSVKQTINGNELIRLAFSNDTPKNMYFTSKIKTISATIIMHLIKHKLYAIAAVCVIIS